MSVAEQARDAAVHCEAKKDRLAQGQSGDWRVTFTVATQDIPPALLAAPMGTRYVLALVEVGDDEQPVQPKPKGGKRAQRAAMLGDQQYWPAIQKYTGANVTSADEAADAIRGYCEVWSRTGLDHDKASADRFDELEREVKALTPLQGNPYDR